jgi:proteasome lid subunit RPN8/RPN11
MIEPDSSNPAISSGDDVVLLSSPLLERLLDAIRRRHPRKSYGYLISDAWSGPPKDFVMFDSNIRNEPGWKGRFESYGAYFVEHSDAGFVASPDEAWRRQKEIWARGMVEIAVFHSHQRHPGNFSRIDFDLHSAGFPSLWHLIVSMRNPAMPQLRGFAVSGAGVRELEMRTDPAVPSWERRDRHDISRSRDRDATIARARRLLELDRQGRPRRLAGDGGDGRSAAGAILSAIEAVARCGDDVVHDLVLEGFLRDRGRRYDEFVAPDMCSVGHSRCRIGTEPDDRRHFCGETPAHVVDLEPYAISRYAVTNEQFARFDPARRDGSNADRSAPVVGVSWFEATLFAMWMGCRLPTETEWEHACGGGSAGEWCCDDEANLGRFAWYSETSAGELHRVGTKEPNPLGAFDLHGNVWEWCLDTYEQDAYPWHAPQPLASSAGAAGDVGWGGHRVCRGGSYHSLSEMCRTRFRGHEPPGYSAGDIGLRLARSSGPRSVRGDDRG